MTLTNAIMRLVWALSMLTFIMGKVTAVLAAWSWWWLLLPQVPTLAWLIGHQ